MVAWRIFSVVLLISLIGMGCTAVPDPTPTPQNLTGDGVTVVGTRPLLTTTPIPSATVIYPTEASSSTHIPSPTSTPRPSRPSHTPTISPSPTPQPLSLSQNIREFTVIDNADSVVWAPAHNELVYYLTCLFQDATTVHFLDMSSPQPMDITPAEDLSCYYISILWHPSGNYFLLSSESSDPERWGEIDGWRVERPDLTITDLGRSSYYWGWLNDDLRISQRRIGTGVFSIDIFDTVSGENISNTNFDGNIVATGNKYVILQSYPFNFNSVAVLAQDPISPEFEGWLHGVHVKFLSWRFDPGSTEVVPSPSSHFVDVLPGTDKILVVTLPLWEFLEDKTILSDSANADLQLWDVDLDELTTVISGGIYGRFSPDGNYLIYLLPATEFPKLELLNRHTEEVVFSQLAYAVADKYSPEVTTFTSFSPNGRTLTFYSPTPELMLYDLETGEFLPPLTAVPYTPLWSPDSSRFVYQHPTDGLSIFDTRTQTAYPLSISGGERLSNPQWSYDGTYLSVTVQQGDGTRDTAVLQIP